MSFAYSKHAKDACAERGIPWSIVESVLDAPEQIVPVQHSKQAHQSRVNMDGEVFLIRVIVGFNTSPPTVVTVYRTRKMAKYWSTK
jgi:hypothetical protein